MQDLTGLTGLDWLLVLLYALGAVIVVEAIRRDGLQIAGWVANILDPEMPRLQENIDTLKQCINEPCLGTVPRLDDLSAERVADFLTVPGQ